MGEKEKKTLREGENQGGQQEAVGERVPCFLSPLGTRYCGSSREGRLENFSLSQSHLFSLQVPSFGSGLRVVSLFAPAATSGGVEDTYMTMLTPSNWETVPTDGALGEESESEPALSRVVLFSYLRWSHGIRLI